MKKVIISICLLSVCLVMSSWGFLGHKTVQQLAIYELPKSIAPFFFKNKEKLVYDAPRPDIRRSSDSTEATKHFIDLEMFGTNAVNDMPLDWDAAVKKYTKDSLLKYGYVPYHVIYMKGKLTEAFREKNKDSILFYAADLGHYISDAHVPLHTTVNYDGQLSNQKGIHSLWESMIPEIEIANYTLNSNHQATYLEHPEQAIWSAIRVSAALVPVMLQQEIVVTKSFTEEQKYRTQMRRGKPSKSYTSEFAKAYAVALKSSINDQLISSANLIADFYYTAWVDAGKPNLQDLNAAFTKADKKSLKAELELYHKNGLIVNDKLIAKKAAATKEEF
ncbi:MAG: zinc dependent phospholipase C family protein [Bacteroidetes bacterium]|nr:zinc dependent phospholipase C family protein [Bacteroidota bacterium]